MIRLKPTTPLQKASATSLVSLTDSFYSAPDSFNNRAKSRERQDSGYGEGITIVCEVSGVSSTFDILKMQTELREATLLTDVSSEQDSKASRKQSPIETQKILKPSKQRTSHQDTRYTDSYPSISRQPSRHHSSSLVSPTTSIYGRPRGLSRTTSINSTHGAEDPYMVHQRATELIQALNNSSPIVRQEPRPSSSDGRRNINDSAFPRSSSVTLIRTSTNHIYEPGDGQASPLYTPANIDWTDPSTRRREYEKYDRNKRGFRGFVKKITPKCLQKDQLEFYNGQSDAGSVRRYRLDLETNPEDFQNEKARKKGHSSAGGSNNRQLRKSRSQWSCFNGFDNDSSEETV
jgi:hypothetical protein